MRLCKHYVVTPHGAAMDCQHLAGHEGLCSFEKPAPTGSWTTPATQPAVRA
jgi:hypothetical protein